MTSCREWKADMTSCRVLTNCRAWLESKVQSGSDCMMFGLSMIEAVVMLEIQSDKDCRLFDLFMIKTAVTLRAVAMMEPEELERIW